LPTFAGKLKNIKFMRKAFLLLFLLGGMAAFAQTSPFDKVKSRSAGEGQITIRQSPDVERSINDYVVSNSRMGGVEGYRIQIYSGTGTNSKHEAQDVRSKFLNQFPNEKVFVEYSAPFMRVRVGSFRHMHEALPLLRKVKASFPSSYIVRDPSIPFNEF
jgi:hypothetical protein